MVDFKKQPISNYQPSVEITNFTNDVRKDYAIGDEILHRTWTELNNRSVIESRLVEWAWQALSEDPKLRAISSEIKSTGEGEWTVKTAKELQVAVPVIEKAFLVRQNSVNDKEDSPQGFRNKVVSAMRGKFGQHAVKK